MVHKNNGFTLIEMIIILAILAIVSTGTIISISRIGYANTVKAAKNIDSAMDKIRLDTMTKKEKQYLYLYNRDGVLYMKISSDAAERDEDLDADTGTRLASKVSLFYISDSTSVELSDGDAICIHFMRSSGAFSTDYEYLRLEGSGKIATIQCVKETGKHYVK